MAAIVSELLSSLKQIGVAFAKDFSVLWIIVPLLTLWVVLEIYFGFYKKEELGWNTSLGNGVTLFWVGLGLVKFLSENSPEGALIKYIIAFLIIVYGSIITFTAFTHKVSKKTEFILAAPSMVFYPALIGTFFVYGVLDITKSIVFAVLVLYLIIRLILLILKKILPEKEDFESNSSDSFVSEDFGKDTNMGDLGDFKI